MTSEVDISVPPAPCPPDQWHPLYPTVTEWLDAEAPARDDKLHNRPRFRKLRRK